MPLNNLSETSEFVFVIFDTIFRQRQTYFLTLLNILKEMFTKPVVLWRRSVLSFFIDVKLLCISKGVNVKYNSS